MLILRIWCFENLSAQEYLFFGGVFSFHTHTHTHTHAHRYHAGSYRTNRVHSASTPLPRAAVLLSFRLIVVSISHNKYVYIYIYVYRLFIRCLIYLCYQLVVLHNFNIQIRFQDRKVYFERSWKLSQSRGSRGRSSGGALRSAWSAWPAWPRWPWPRPCSSTMWSWLGGLTRGCGRSASWESGVSGLRIKQILNLKGWNSQVQRGIPGNLEPTILSLQILCGWRWGLTYFSHFRTQYLRT